MPPLLHEYLLALKHLRRKNRVKINAHKVGKVAVVAACNGVARLVGKGEGIEKGRHRALEQIDERFLYRVTVRAAEHRMLKDMEHARAVLRHGPEHNRKDLVVVVAAEIYQFCARSDMFKLIKLGADLVHIGHASDAEASVSIADSKSCHFRFLRISAFRQSGVFEHIIIMHGARFVNHQPRREERSKT